MDSDLKAKWVTALRSGNYKQCREYLHKEDSYCCLGVLCEISGEGFWHTDAESSRYMIDGVGLRATLPSGIVQKYEVLGSGKLIEMNDTGKPFTEIADYIEANL